VTNHRNARRHHAAGKHRRQHHATSRPQARVEAAQRRPATFAASLALALRVPVAAPVAAAGHGFDDIFLLASIALLLFVLGGLMVVRSSARVMRQERPA
jgi:hypothetical protein